jgi:hypothetical protein
MLVLLRGKLYEFSTSEIPSLPAISRVARAQTIRQSLYASSLDLLPAVVPQGFGCK